MSPLNLSFLLANYSPVSLCFTGVTGLSLRDKQVSQKGPVKMRKQLHRKAEQVEYTKLLYMYGSHALLVYQTVQ